MAVGVSDVVISFQDKALTQNAHAPVLDIFCGGRGGERFTCCRGAAPLAATSLLPLRCSIMRRCAPCVCVYMRVRVCVCAPCACICVCVYASSLLPLRCSIMRRCAPCVCICVCVYACVHPVRVYACAYMLPHCSHCAAPSCAAVHPECVYARA